MSDGSQKSLVDIALTDRTGSKTLLTLTCLLGTWLLGFGSRLFAVIRFESIIHEFDPWFNYRATHHLSGKFSIQKKILNLITLMNCGPPSQNSLNYGLSFRPEFFPLNFQIRFC